MRRRAPAFDRMPLLMARDIRIALVGFGNVGRRFVEQLRGPYARVLREHGLRARVTGIATAHHGIAVDARGIDLARALRLVAKGQSLDAAPPRPAARGRAGVHRAGARRRADRGHDPGPAQRPARDRSRAPGPRPRAARDHRQQGAGRLRARPAAPPGRAQEEAVPARGRGDGRDAGLQPGRALPRRGARALVPRHAQQHEQPRALAHGGGRRRRAPRSGRRSASGSPRPTRGTTSTAGMRP